MFTSVLAVFLAPAVISCADARYVVLVDTSKSDEYLPAAKALAAFHQGALLPFHSDKLDDAFAELKEKQPDFVVFVLPPEKIDVDLTHAILRRSTLLDDDPFQDFEYGFISGRDGAAALRLVETIKAAWKREYGRTAGFFGSWEGLVVPPNQTLSAFKALKMQAEQRFVLARAPEAERRQAAREALAKLGGKDALLFFSHGYPHEMGACFQAKDLIDWNVRLGPAVLVNCSCYNGAPGRWFAAGPNGPEERPPTPAADSVALAILDSGVPAYFAGVDPWHGPLAIQVFNYVVDDGLRIGQAAKRMHDRLALDFYPERVYYEPTAAVKNRFGGDGQINRRHNGAGMILYGDPAWAPFAKNASRLGYGEWKRSATGRTQLRMGLGPLVDGQPGQDFIIPLNVLLDYYSAKTNDVLTELSLEVYRVLPLPAGAAGAPNLTIKSARVGKQDIPTGTPQIVMEQRGTERLLHIRAPLRVRAYGANWAMTISAQGLELVLEESE
jgi:hypothetical protein